MKIRNYFLGLLGLVAIGLTASCSNDDIQPNEGTLSDGQPRYITVNLVNTDGATTRGDQYTDESNATYEDGEAAENQVTNAIFFFFTNDGDAKTVTSNQVPGAVDAKNYLNVTSFSELGPNHAETVEEVLSTTLVIQVAAGTGLPSQMAAVLNVPLSVFTENTYTLEELNAIVADYKTDHTSAGSFVITSSVWAESDDKIDEIGTAEVAAYGAKEQAIANPVKIYVERALAKVRVKLANGISSGATGASATIKDGNKTYVSTGQTVQLDPADASTAKEIYAKFDNWYVTSESNTSYLIKNLSMLKNANGMWTNWTYPTFHRSFWAYTPVEHTGFEYLYNKWNADGSKSYNGDEYYTQENTYARFVRNTAENTKLNKDAKVLISAELGYFTDPTDAETWTPLTIGMFGQEKYPITAGNDYLMTAALKYLKDQGQLDYWYFEDNTWKQIDESFFTYQGISEYTNPTSYNKENVTTLINVARYESRIILNETAAAAKGQWYKKLKKDDNDPTVMAAPEEQPATSQIALSEIKGDIAANLPNVKVWTEGKAYYYFPIRHLGNGTPAAPGRGYYGVVRNHIYDCTISTLTGIGTPVFDPDEFIVPEPVQEDKDTYVAAQINILSWRVVNNTVDLK